MYINTITRSGRVASQYKLKSSINNNQKKGAIKENIVVKESDEKVIAKKNDNSPDNINQHDEVKKSGVKKPRKAVQTKRSVNTVSIGNKGRPTEKSNLIGRKKTTKANKTTVVANKGNVAQKINQCDDVKKRGGRNKMKVSLSTDNKRHRRQCVNTALIVNKRCSDKPASEAQNKSDREVIAENENDSKINNHDNVKTSADSSSSITSEQTRNISKPNISDQKSVYVICERNSTLQNVAATTEKSFSLPICILTYDPTIEQAITKLSTTNILHSSDVKESMLIPDVNNEEKCVSRTKNNLKTLLTQRKDGKQQKNKTIEQTLREENIESEGNIVDMVHSNSNIRSNKVNNNMNPNKNQVDESHKMRTANGRKKNQKRIVFNTSNTKDKNDNINKKPKRLRFRTKTFNYNEITLTNSLTSINSTIVEKVDRQPIYKKKIISPLKQTRGRKKDVYEFKEDKSISEGEFEKGTASLIKVFEREFNNKKAANKPKKKALKNTKQNLNKENVQKIKQTLIKTKSNKQNADKNIEALKNTKNEITKDEHIVDVNGIIKNINENNQKNYHRQQINANEIEFIGRRGSLSRSNTPLSCYSNQGSSGSFQFIDSPLHISSPSEGSKSTPIKILSNVVVTGTSTYDDNIPFNDSIHINFKKPNANSTMFIQRSPWRPALALKKNPLFLTTNKSSLPTYDQEMVINFKMLNKSCSTPVKKQDKVQANSDLQKMTKQNSILNYINSSRPTEPTQDENRFNYSLFDADQLSPVKNGQSPRNNALKDCTNIISTKNILGVKNVPVSNVEGSNKPSAMKHLPLYDVEDCENHPPSKERSQMKHLPLIDSNKFPSSPAKTVSSIDDSFSFLGGEKTSPIKQAKPTRLSMNEVKRVIFGDGKVKKRIVPEEGEPVIAIDGVNGAEDNVEMDEQNDIPVVGLFEDFEKEKVPPKVTYGRAKGRTKRQRYVYIDEELEDETVEHTRKRRKDVRTKKEELDAERSAAKFNEMCKEIDKYQLTVE